MRIEDPQGRRLSYWAPDERARGYVRGLGYLAQLVKANENVASADTQLMLMVAALVPLSMPAHLVRTVVAAAVGAADVADILFNQIPDYFQRRAEVMFATQASALLSPGRVTQAEMDSPSMLGTVIAAVGSAVGLRCDAADLLRAARTKPPIKEMGEMIAAKGHAQMIEAIWDFPPAQKQSFVAAAAEVTAKARSAGEAALSIPERDIWRVVQELESPAGRAVIAAKRAARDTILEFDGPVVPSMSSKYKVVPDKKPELPNFKIVGAVGRGEYCTVWDYVDHLTGGVANKVLKMVRRASAEDLSSAEEVLQRMLDAQALLKRANIPHKPIIAHRMTPEPYFLQERIPVNSDRFKLLDPRDLAPGEFTPQLQEAVLELYQKLGRAGLVWTDGKLDNIYFELVDGKWVAGVLDTDFIVEFGKPIQNAYNARRLRTMEAWPGKYGIRSADADIDFDLACRWTEAGAVNDPTRLYPSAEFAMMKMLEWRGFVEVGYTTNLWSGRLIEDLELVERYFPGFRTAKYDIPKRAETSLWNPSPSAWAFAQGATRAIGAAAGHIIKHRPPTGHFARIPRRTTRIALRGA
jgi:hypothetical protein